MFQFFTSVKKHSCCNNQKLVLNRPFCEINIKIKQIINSYNSSKTNGVLDSVHQGVNKFILYFNNVFINAANRRNGYQNYLPKIPKPDISNYNVIINSKYFFDQQVNNNIRTYENIRKITTS